MITEFNSLILPGPLGPSPPGVGKIRLLNSSNHGIAGRERSSRILRIRPAVNRNLLIVYFYRAVGPGAVGPVEVDYKIPVTAGRLLTSPM